MGFDIDMVNKIISFFKIKTENEAIDYLVKTEDGMWNHPFIPKQKDNEEQNNSFGIISSQKKLVSSVINNIRSNDVKIPKNRISNSVNVNAQVEHNNLNESNLCEICDERKELHKIKNYSLKNENKNKNNFRGIEIINNNRRNNILIDEDEDENFNINNNINNSNNYNISNNNILNSFNENNQINNPLDEEEINRSKSKYMSYMYG